MALQRIPAVPKVPSRPIKGSSTPPTVPPAPTTTLPPDPLERNKAIRTGSADTSERSIEFKTAEERLAATQGKATSLGIPVSPGMGLEPYVNSPYYKETKSTGQVIFTNPNTGKDIYYDPATGLVPGFESYGRSREFIMDNLPKDPVERNNVLKWLKQQDADNGSYDINSLNVPKGKLSAWAKTLTNPLALIQLPGKAVIAGIEQLSNIPSGTASLEEMNKDLLDPKYGFGSVVGDVTGNKWLDRAIGLAGDIVLDPTNYILPGGSALADVALTGATRIAVKDASKLLAGEVVDAAGKAVLRQGAEQGLRIAGVADNVIEDLVINAGKVFSQKPIIRSAILAGDQVAIAAARETEKIAQAALEKTAAEIAKVVKIGKGGRVITKVSKAGKIITAEGIRAQAFGQKQLAKKALDEAIATGDKALISRAQSAFDTTSQLLDNAVEDLVSLGNIKGVPVRKYGEKSRLALADRVKSIRAKAILDAEDATLDATTRASAQAVADTLTDANLSKVAQFGWASIRGDLAEALGARGGLRYGTKRFNKRIYNSGGVADVIGDTTSKARIKLQDLVGDKFLKAITPVAKSGVIDPEVIIEMRTALRTGKAGPDAINFLNIISFNDAVTRARSLTNSRATVVLNNTFASGDSRIADSIVQYLTVPQAEWAIQGLKTPSKRQLDLIDRVRKTIEFWYNEANAMHKALGNTEELPRVYNYFPLVQTDVFSDWAIRNPNMSINIGQVIEPTVVDPTWIATNFLERKLVPGKSWFGHILTPEDVRAGASRLNAIAKESGVFGKRNINVFEEGLVPALTKYASKHARYLAFGRTVLDITNPVSSYLDTFRRALTATTTGVSPSTLSSIDNLEATTRALLTPARLANWVPEDIDEVFNKLSEIDKVLDDAVAAGNVTPINAERFRESVADVEKYVNDITQAIRNGDYPETLIPLALTDLDNYALNVIEDIQDIGFKALTLPADKWKDVVRVTETGFEVLNYKTIPNITARNEVYELLTNVRKLENPGVAREFSNLANAYQQWWKSWVLATPRYVRRNAFSDSFQMLLAGVNLKEARRSLVIWRDFVKSGKSLELYALNLPLEERNIFIQAASSIPQEVQKLPSEEFAKRVQRTVLGGRPAGSSGEIAGELIGGAGMFGSPATGRLPILGRYGYGPESKLAAKGSTLLASPVNIARSISSNIGDVQRYILTHDGLAKGLSLEEAVVRTNKYLIDYSSTSKLDDVVKRTVMPFWMFASRNLPMQYENMLRHPRVFNRYFAVKKFLEARDEDKQPYQSDISSKAGAFQLDPDIVKLLGNDLLENIATLGLGAGAFFATSGFGRGSKLVSAIPLLAAAVPTLTSGVTDSSIASKFTPDFGFPGGGRPNELASIPKEILSLFGITNRPSSTVLSQLPAPIRSFLETATNRKFYSMNDLVSSYSELTPQEQTALYFISQTVPQLSWLGQIPYIRGKVDIAGNQRLAQVLGVPLSFSAIPEGEPGSTEDRIRIANQKAAAGNAGWIGSVAIPMTESEQLAEISRRRKALEELIANEER